MGYNIVYLYKFLDEWEPEYLVVSTEYSISIGKGDEDEISTEPLFRKNYNACVSVYVTTPKRSYIKSNAKWVLKYAAHELGNVYDFYIGLLHNEYGNTDQINLSCNVRNVEGNVCLNWHHCSLWLCLFGIAIDCFRKIFTMCVEKDRQIRL